MEINKDVQEVIVSYMGKIEGVVQNMSDFATDQIPLVIQEYLAWHFYSNMITCVLLLSLSSTAAFIGCKMLKLRKNYEPGGYEMGPKEGCVVVAIISFIIATILAGSSTIPTKEMVKVKVAPRVVLIDWLKESVQK